MASGISSRTKICGIFGCPLEHSFSPAMQNAAFKAAGLDYIYLPFVVAPGQLVVAVEAIRTLGLAGVNVTIPHKEAALSLLDELSGEARLIGAVNTIVNRAGRLYGDNTDGRGFLRSLKEEAAFIPAGKTALILGAGGAARAVAAQLALAGVKKLILSNRSSRRAVDLAGYIAKNTGVKAQTAPWPENKSETLPGALLQEADLVVQATSIGMHRSNLRNGPILRGGFAGGEKNILQTVPLPFHLFRTGQVAYDLVYNPLETVFLKKAGQAGAVTVSGLGMLLYQGALSFEMWTGEPAPVEVMKKALQKECYSKG